MSKALADLLQIGDPAPLRADRCQAMTSRYRCRQDAGLVLKATHPKRAPQSVKLCLRHANTIRKSATEVGYDVTLEPIPRPVQDLT